ncbi:hypothetical protein FFT09_22715 [Saccharomonospora piscinae]|uniref:hypothetical protein n=1 Tax=Saccharomonospora piscinae TaxID=687388 RepID=UPI001106146E|nr:hypothetical protein [Saccharomonospora piscinae]TLW89242.1 hypothetical protein FFT09_22715 [Saccharomonospora piscinae]
MEDEEPKGFITQAAQAPSVGLSPRWVQYSGVSPVARTIAELLTDDLLTAQGDNAGGVLDREYLAYEAGLGRADKVGAPLNELVGIGFLTIFDGGVDPETGRRRPRRDASGNPLPARYVINLEPPAGYLGPRNRTEARARYIVDRDLAYREVEKAGRKPRAGRVTIRRTEVGRVEAQQAASDANRLTSLPIRSPELPVSRDKVKTALLTVGWKKRGITPAPKVFSELVDLAYTAMSRYGATLDQVRWYAARKLIESTSNPPSYVMKAFRERTAEIAREPDPNEVLEFKDDPELVEVFARKGITREGARGAAKTVEQPAEPEKTVERLELDCEPGCDYGFVVVEEEDGVTRERPCRGCRLRNTKSA